MRLTINSDTLKKHKLSFSEFLVLLIGYYDIDISSCFDTIIEKKLAEKNLFKNGIILSNNSKSLIQRIIVESSDKIANSTIDFKSIALKLQALYPDGIKAGKTYKWRGEVEDIMHNLMLLVVKYDFQFTEQEAIDAVKEYVQSFTPPYRYMHTLRNFILFENKDNEMESLFMTIIENKRQ